MTAFVILDRGWNDYWQEQLTQWDAREYETGFDALEELRHWLREGWAFTTREAAETEATERSGQWDVHELDAGDVAELIARFVRGESVEDARARAGEARRLAALSEHREGTQFQPLDPASPTVLLQVKVPKSLVNVVDLLAHAAGQSRSEYVRGLIHKAVSESDVTAEVFAKADALHADVKKLKKRR